MKVVPIRPLADQRKCAGCVNHEETLDSKCLAKGPCVRGGK